MDLFDRIYELIGDLIWLALCAVVLFALVSAFGPIILDGIADALTLNRAES